MGTPGKVTNFPNGVSSFGVPVVQGNSGGGRIVLHVCNRTGMPAGDGSTRDNPLSTLFGTSGALAKVNSATDGADIHVWPGHTESITAADFGSDTGTAQNISIIGHGFGTSRPTLTWTATGSTWLFDTVGIQIENFRLLMDPGTGTVNVAAPITVSAAGCAIRNCYVRVSTDANSKTTVPLTLATGADDFTLQNVHFEGATAGEVTTVITAADIARLRCYGLRINAATSSTTVGVVRFTAAGTNMYFDSECYLENNKAASTCAMNGFAGCTGLVDFTLAVLSAGAAALVWDATGALRVPGNLKYGHHASVVNTVAERAAPPTPLSA